MTLLLDTHALLWFLSDDKMLSPVAKVAIEDPSNRKFVSIATCWEVAIKAGLKKLTLAESSQSLLAREIPRNNFELLPIQLHHATAVEVLPLLHRDPFDRILAAQSLIDGLVIVSRDNIFDSYGVQRI